MSCPNHCATCSDAETCLTCPDNSNRSPAPACPCVSGFYEEDEICKACNFKCLECEMDAENCTVCADSRLNLPACDECPVGMYDDDIHVDC